MQPQNKWFSCSLVGKNHTLVWRNQRRFHKQRQTLLNFRQYSSSQIRIEQASIKTFPQNKHFPRNKHHISTPLLPPLKFNQYTSECVYFQSTSYPSQVCSASRAKVAKPDCTKGLVFGPQTHTFTLPPAFSQVVKLSGAFAKRRWWRKNFLITTWSYNEIYFYNNNDNTNSQSWEMVGKRGRKPAKNGARIQEKLSP